MRDGICRYTHFGNLNYLNSLTLPDGYAGIWGGRWQGKLCKHKHTIAIFFFLLVWRLSVQIINGGKWGKRLQRFLTEVESFWIVTTGMILKYPLIKSKQTYVFVQMHTTVATRVAGRLWWCVRSLKALQFVLAQHKYDAKHIIKESTVHVPSFNLWLYPTPIWPALLSFTWI